MDADADLSNNFAGRGAFLADERSLVDPTDLLDSRNVFGTGTLDDTGEADERLDVGDFRATGADIETPRPPAVTRERS